MGKWMRKLEKENKERDLEEQEIDEDNEFAEVKRNKRR